MSNPHSDQPQRASVYRLDLRINRDLASMIREDLEEMSGTWILHKFSVDYEFYIVQSNEGNWCIMIQAVSKVHYFYHHLPDMGRLIRDMEQALLLNYGE